MNNDGVKISEMPELSALHDSTVVAGVSKGINYKIPARLLKGTSTKVEVEKEDGKVTINVTDDEGETSTDFNVPTEEQLASIDEIPTIKQDLADEISNREQADSEMDSAIKAEAEARQQADDNLSEKITTEENGRQEADNNLQSQIDALADRSDVVDVVNTYAELQSYDTSRLGDNDVIKVLNDETHDGAITYYRWNKTEGEWKYVGETGPYYTKAETDEKLQAETTAREQAVEGIQHDIENLTELMPTVVQETGDSETDVMSQKAVTDALANAGGGGKLYEEYGENTDGALTQKFVSDKLNNTKVEIGSGATSEIKTGLSIGENASTNGRWGIAIGTNSQQSGDNNIAIGRSAVATQNAGGTAPRIAIGNLASATADFSVALGYKASTPGYQSVALGSESTTSRNGEVSVGSSAIQRYLANIKAGELDTDAVNLKQLNDMVGNINTILETLISGEGAKA